MRYRRADISGGIYFFTVNLAERKRRFLVGHIDILRSVMRKVKTTHPYPIDATIILPDHVVAIFTLPEADCDYPTRWMLITQPNPNTAASLNASRYNKPQLTYFSKIGDIPTSKTYQRNQNGLRSYFRKDDSGRVPSLGRTPTRQA